MPEAPRTYLCTWMYGDAPGEESVYPQVAGVSSAPAFQEVYWRCVAIFFASSARHNPEARHLLFTNVSAVPTVDGLDLAAFLDGLGVEVVPLPLTYHTPEGYYGAWRNQFYVFDAVAHLAGRLADDDRCVLLDSDCVWVRSADALAEAVAREGALTYDIGLRPGWPQNGLNREEMGAIFSELLPERPVASPLYFGGEIFAATGRETRRVAAEILPLWETLLARHRAGRPKLNEEAHALSFVYHKLGYGAGTADPFIKRIWTTLLYESDAAASDLDLTVWHLPAEKRFGLRRMYDDVRDPASAFWQTPTGPAFRRYAGAVLGVPRRSPAKLVRDVATAVREKRRGEGVVAALRRAAVRNLTTLRWSLRDRLRPSTPAR